MNAVNIKEARRRLSELVGRAAHGESVWITRRGRKVARLDPADSDRAGGLPDLTEFRKSIAVRGKALSRTVADLRRDARY